MKPGFTKSDWPKLVILGVVAAFVANAIYIYATKFSTSIHSDNAIGILVGWKILHQGVPILRDWYYSNGDVWTFGPHLYALLPLAVWGVGPTTLLVTILVGFALQLAALYWSYQRVSLDRWASVLGAVLTLVAWSRMHLTFVYLDLAYGFYAALYAFLFTLHVCVTQDRIAGRSGRRFFVPMVVFALLVSLQFPTRGLVFVVAPLLAAFAWPFRGLPIRVRVVVGGSLFASWIAAYCIYRFVFLETLSFSNPSGHSAFALRDLAGVAFNLKTLSVGLFGLVGDGDVRVSSLPGLVFLFGGIGLVVREIVRSRDFTPLRFLSIAILVQLALVLGPLVLGNLVVNDASIRYVMPSVLVTYGLAALIAMRDIRALGKASRAIAKGWLVLAPIATALAIASTLTIYNLESKTGQWAHRRSHHVLAAFLTEHHLVQGFATYWNANLTTLLSHGATKTCSVNFSGGGLVPYRWNTETECFDATRLPDTFYVVNRFDEREAAEPAVKNLPEPIAKYSVGNDFDVRVYAKEATPLAWLTLPLPEGDGLARALPLHLDATHPQMGRGKVKVVGTSLVSEGEGVITYGPYLTMPKGKYRVRWFGSGIPSPGSIHFDVGAEAGAATLGKQDTPTAKYEGVSHREVASIDFATTAAVTKAIEFRVYSVDGGKIALDGFVLDAR